MPDMRALFARARRLLLRYRRVLSALLAALAVLGVVESLSPATPRLHDVVVVSHDVSSGVTLTGNDVTVEQVPQPLVPDGTSSSPSAVVGRTVGGPMRAGEPVTDRRLLGRPMLSGYPQGLVAAPVRIRDAAVVGLLQAGERVSVYAAGGDTSYAALVLERVSVVALPPVDDAQEGGLVVLAVTPSQAAALAQASATAPLSVTLLR